jgi:hypothetical protein
MLKKQLPLSSANAVVLIFLPSLPSPSLPRSPSLPCCHSSSLAFPHLTSNHLNSPHLLTCIGFTCSGAKVSERARPSAALSGCSAAQTTTETVATLGCNGDANYLVVTSHWTGQGVIVPRADMSRRLQCVWLVSRSVGRSVGRSIDAVGDTRGW